MLPPSEEIHLLNTYTYRTLSSGSPLAPLETFPSECVSLGSSAYCSCPISATNIIHPYLRLYWSVLYIAPKRRPQLCCARSVTLHHSLPQSRNLMDESLVWKLMTPHTLRYRYVHATLDFCYDRCPLTIRGTLRRRIALTMAMLSTIRRQGELSELWWTWPVLGRVPPRISHLTRLTSWNFQTHTLGLSIMAIKTRLRLTLPFQLTGPIRVSSNGNCIGGSQDH